MGAVFALPWTRLPDWDDALPALSERGFTTVALTLADDAAPVEEAVAGVDRLALVLGSEGHGLSPRWEQTADRRAIIPMRAASTRSTSPPPPPWPATWRPGADLSLSWVWT